MQAAEGVRGRTIRYRRTGSPGQMGSRHDMPARRLFTPDHGRWPCTPHIVKSSRRWLTPTVRIKPIVRLRSSFALLCRAREPVTDGGLRTAEPIPLTR